MFVGRERELGYLTEYHKNAGNKVLVIYGKRGIGKTTLLKRFVKGKTYFFYEAVSCSSKQQKQFMGKQLQKYEVTVAEDFSYREMFEELEKKSESGIVIVIDEVQNICKSDNEFLEELSVYCNTGGENVFFVLCSSMIGWVENSLKDKLGNITGIRNEFYKIKDLNFKEFKEYFPRFSKEDCVGAFAVLGGIPGLWKYFSDEYTLKENIKKFILAKETEILELGNRYVEEELRETAVYNTILTALAEGKHKLNELHLYTGFSRAKISVYLKNLMQLDFVEKVSSVDTPGRENACKGFYRISCPFLQFYYQYLFPNQNEIGLWQEEDFYEQWIAPTFSKIAARGFVQVCCEFLEKENHLGRLPEKFSYLGQWHGKTGNIDLIFQNEDGEILSGICNWEKEIMVYEEYSRFLEYQKSAKMKAEYVVLFSKDNFDNRLREENKKNPYVALVSLGQMDG